MILFGHIIEQAGFDVEDFSTLADIPVKMSDRKNRELTEEREFEFNKKMFCKNYDSKKRFRKVLEMLSKSYTKLPDEIYGKLDDNALILSIPGLAPKIFWFF